MKPKFKNRPTEPLFKCSGIIAFKLEQIKFLTCIKTCIKKKPNDFNDLKTMIIKKVA